MLKSNSGKFLLPLALGGALLTGCSVGPDYVQPTVPEPASYKEGINASQWKKAEPRDDISKGDWYAVFHDPKLNEIEAQALASNQNLRAAIARVSESRAVARQSEAAFFPSIDFSASGDRQRTSPNNGQLVAQIGKGNTTPYTFNSATVVPFDLSYELDLWGKIRRAFESAGDRSQASAADFENVVLTLKADVATTYFGVRTADSQIGVQLRTIKSFQDAPRPHRQPIQGRHQHGARCRSGPRHPRLRTGGTGHAATEPRTA